MKKIVILIVLICTTIFAGAQQIYKDIVYLKNGSIIHGKIIELIPGKSIKIESRDSNIFVFQMDEIEKLTKEPIQKGSSSGYFGIAQMGYAFGETDYGMDFLKLNIINGYRIDPYFAVGAGYGIRYYIEEKVPLIPVFADFRVDLFDNKISTFFSFDFGYSFYAKDRFAGCGMLLTPSAGLNFKVADNSVLSVAVSYEIQKYDTYMESTNAPCLSLGISF